MAIELIRLKLNSHDAPGEQLLGSVVINGDGTADFFRDACDHAEIIAALLEEVNTDVPLARVRPEDLIFGQACERCARGDDCRDGDCLRVDVVGIGAERVIGPLLLRRDMPVAVGGAIDDTLAAIILRELRSFKTARGAIATRDGSDRSRPPRSRPIRVAA